MVMSFQSPLVYISKDKQNFRVSKFVIGTFVGVQVYHGRLIKFVICRPLVKGA